MIPPHPLINFEIEAYCQNKPRFNGIALNRIAFNGVYSTDNLPERSSTEKIKDGAYVINLDEYSDIGTHWVALYVNNKTATYFDEHIPKEIKKFIGNKNIIGNIVIIQANDSIMWGCFCIGFVDFMFNGNSLTDFTNLFLPNDFKKMMI